MFVLDADPSLHFLGAGSHQLSTPSLGPKESWLSPSIGSTRQASLSWNCRVFESLVHRFFLQGDVL